MMYGTYLRVCQHLSLHDNECFWLIGVKKKLTHLAKTKQCDLIGDWIKSITNHLYWCAASAPDGDGDEIVKRWKSLMNHLCNTHDSCYHDPLNSLEERRKMWFVPGSYLTLKLTLVSCCTGSKASEKLDDVVTNTRLLQDMKKLSPLYQTSSLEAYHSVVNHFAPKLMQFSDHGIHSRYPFIVLIFTYTLHYIDY